jgi:hypothetical protein
MTIRGVNGSDHSMTRMITLAVSHLSVQKSPVLFVSSIIFWISSGFKIR